LASIGGERPLFDSARRRLGPPGGKHTRRTAAIDVARTVSSTDLDHGGSACGRGTVDRTVVGEITDSPRVRPRELTDGKCSSLRWLSGCGLAAARIWAPPTWTWLALLVDPDIERSAARERIQRGCPFWFLRPLLGRRGTISPVFPTPPGRYFDHCRVAIGHILE